MRDLHELKMNEGKRPIAAGKLVIRPAPTEEQIMRLESRYGVKLPIDYVSFLRFSNGGHPQLCAFLPKEASWPDICLVNVFYHLDDDETHLRGVCRATDAWRDAFNIRFIA